MKRNKKGFTLIEILVCIAIIAVMGIAIGIGTNKLSQNTKNTNNEKLLKEILSAGNTYCQLSAHKLECTNDAKITFDKLITAGVLDEKILNKDNPTKKDNSKFNKNDEIVIGIVDGEREIIFSCLSYDNKNYEYKLSTIDNCSKEIDKASKENICNWGVCQ